MSRFNQKDMTLLSEAYTLRLLKESAPSMTLMNIESRIPYMSKSEAEYIAVVCERITDYMLEEGMFGNALRGLKNIGGAAKNAGQAVAGRAANAVGNAASAAGQAAQGVGRGIAAGAGAIKDNVKDMYNTGKVAGEADDAIKQAQSSAQQLIDLVTQAQQKGLIQAQGSVVDMTLADLIDELTTAQQSASTFQQGAQQKGFTGGAMDKAKAAYRAPAPGSVGSSAPATA